jgi:hypothetical protein
LIAAEPDAPVFDDERVAVGGKAGYRIGGQIFLHK